MSIVDLLKSVDTLAKLITQKNQELESLKKNYDAKLNQINKFINLINSQTSLEQEPPRDEISDDELLKIIDKKISCLSCHQEIWDINEDTDFIIIPKKKIQFLLKQQQWDQKNSNELSDKLNNISIGASATDDRSPSPYQSTYTPHKKSNFKKTCSYCHKKGHSRARCLERLNNVNDSTTKKE